MATEAAGAQPNIGEAIIHHVSNGEAFFPIKIPLGRFGTLDMSITKHVVMLWIAAVLVMIAFTWLARHVRKADDSAPKGSLANMFEFFVSFVREQMVLPFIGEKYSAKFTPLILTFFTFILFSNLLGLTPLVDMLMIPALKHGSSSPMGNFNVTAGLAIVTFCSIIYAGSVAHGIVGHWKNLVPHGLAWPVYIILIPIEIISMFVKPFALTMRLAANMTAGHAAILAIMSFIFVFQSVLIGLAVSLPLMIGLMLLEIIVCFVQAYVFALLSALFIGMAIHVHH